MLSEGVTASLIYIYIYVHIIDVSIIKPRQATEQWIV